ncbi:MAG: hypothetical protein JWO82_1468, partial [Akkermansiaceae bacterium]|nr:hypothetical protein [Akkermansiaceae bacterium]
TVTKTRNHRRYVDLEDALRRWLEPWAKSKGSILPANFQRRRQRLVNGFYTTPGATLANPGSWRPLVEWEPDITRHSYASYWEAAHRTEPACRERLAANMGHTNYKTFETKYRNARTTDQATEFWGIKPPVGEANIISIA